MDDGVDDQEEERGPQTQTDCAPSRPRDRRQSHIQASRQRMVSSKRHYRSPSVHSPSDRASPSIRTRPFRRITRPSTPPGSQQNVSPSPQTCHERVTSFPGPRSLAGHADIMPRSPLPHIGQNADSRGNKRWKGRTSSYVSRSRMIVGNAQIRWSGQFCGPPRPADTSDQPRASLTAAARRSIASPD